MRTNQIQFIDTPLVQIDIKIQRIGLANPDGNVSGFAPETGAQTNALAALALLNTACADGTTVVNQHPLGPYNGTGSCSPLCSQTYNWQYRFDFTFFNSLINTTIGTVNLGSGYNDAFQPTQTWLETNLPNYSNALTGNITTILQIDTAVKNAGGTITPEQTAQLATAFSNLNTVLQNNLNEFNNGLQKIAAFLNQQNSQINYLQNQAANFQANIQGTISGVVINVPCGKNDIEMFFDSVRSQVNSIFSTMQPSFNTINYNFQTALQAIEKVAGVFLSLQTNNDLITRFINQAQTLPPVSINRMLLLENAVGTWNDLVTEANLQLKANS